MNGSAIQLNEWASTPRTNVMDRTSDQLFASSGFYLDQHGGIRRRHTFYVFEELFERRAIADQLFESSRREGLIVPLNCVECPQH